jgi:hypothetical protein
MRQPEPWQVPPQSQAQLVAKAVMGEPLQPWEKVELAALLRLSRHRAQALKLQMLGMSRPSASTTAATPRPSRKGR